MFIDTHAHLDLPAIINRAQKAGVGKIITIGIDYKSSQRAIEIASQYENVFATVSLHPIHADENFDFEKFKKLSGDKKVMAIGETGLDYKSINNEQLAINKQKEIFISFIKIAMELDKPLIIHSRESEKDVLGILKKYQNKIRGIMHCFPGDWALAQKVIELGFLISFTGSITYNLSKKTREVIEKSPLDKIMIETDCPFMTPLKYRHKDKQVRNEPAYVVEVAQKIAEIKHIPIEEVARQTTQNAQNLFKI